VQFAGQFPDTTKQGNLRESPALSAKSLCLAEGSRVWRVKTNAQNMQPPGAI
jgi:hypothetical protein